MYKTNKKFNRIDWVYAEYANSSEISLTEFINAVNKAYYSNSVNLYTSRYVKDIHQEYLRMFDHLDINNTHEKKYIVDIGGGAGFEFDLIKKSLVEFSHFKFIEPSTDMLNLFMKSIDLKIETNISFHNGHFSEIINEIKKESNKLLIINSALHHVIKIEKMLNDIKSSMIKGDIFILGHEPNNDYSSFMMFLQNFLKTISTNVLLKKFTKLFNDSTNDSNRWDLINMELLEQRYTIKKMQPLLIRRIIDYGVGYKKDWNKLNIPDEFNEGFWNINDISDYLGVDYQIKYYKTYRHFGDSRGNMFLGKMNEIFSQIFTNFGTNFIAVWEKK